MMHVVPLVGTWIEIPIVGKLQIPLRVVPLVGTWIEIQPIFPYLPKNRRAPRGHVD